MIEIDYARAVELIKGAVADRGPDYVYEKELDGNCVYFAAVEDPRTGKVSYAPSCLVGEALSRAGVSAWNILEVDMNAEPFEVVADALMADEGIALTPKAIYFLESVQAEQDARVPWGDALGSALRQSARVNEDGTEDRDW